MYRTAFLFPGQGAQYAGMAKEFYDAIPESRKVFEEAKEAIGFDLTEICFEENDKLNQTEYTQVAMVTACCSILEAVKKENIVPDVTAGLSLGEYCSLIANNTFTFSDAVKLVRKRGILMAEEVTSGIGGMSAVLGLENEIIEDICRDVTNETGEIVVIANYNTTGQIVISGSKVAIASAAERLKEAGAKRVLELKVSGPFHSELLKGAGIKLAAELDPIQLHDMKYPYISNVTAEVVHDIAEVKTLLSKQVYSPVRFQQTIQKMIELGVETFIEIGPGKTLSGFVKRFDKTKKIINIDKFADMEKITNL